MFVECKLRRCAFSALIRPPGEHLDTLWKNRAGFPRSGFAKIVNEIVELRVFASSILAGTPGNSQLDILSPGKLTANLIRVFAGL
jgi:hypothetical protein